MALVVEQLNLLYSDPQFGAIATQAAQMLQETRDVFEEERASVNSANYLKILKVRCESARSKPNLKILGLNPNDRNA